MGGGDNCLNENGKRMKVEQGSHTAFVMVALKQVKLALLMSPCFLASPLAHHLVQLLS